ncbi:hypothetical protein RI537_23605 [Aeromonas salmonicida]|uniref:hypothetical protein n=1 Tax=Aeromonas salmonicida TaxID=645 RepID=UPI003422457B
MVDRLRQGKPSLIPLEYCTPERAARLLCCELEDIYHWAYIGAIRFYADFTEYEFYYSEYDNSLISNDDISSRIAAEVIVEDTIPKIYSYSDQRRNEFGLYGPDGFLYDTSLIFPPQDESFNVKFLLSGLWEVNNFRLSNAEIFGRRSPSRWDLRASYIGEGNSSARYIHLIDIEINNMTTRLRVMHDDLKKIHEHMLSGELMVKNSYINQVGTAIQTLERKDKHHGNKERFAATRESVLKVAIYAKIKWPDECNTAKSWAETILDQEWTLFGEEGCPLEVNTIERLLGTAMNKP